MRRILFNSTGVHCVVDGQFGSTGKGALSAWLAARALATGGTYFQGAICSNGPNSGHTFYHDGEKHVLKQLPVFAVATTLMGGNCPAYLSAGAVINPNILFEEAQRYPALKIYVHPNAAVVNIGDIELEQMGSIAAIASTQSGTGAALARKVHREHGAVVMNNLKMANMPRNVSIQAHFLHPEEHAYFMEVAQGFSLGINSEFYPHVTSRECTVMQGLADARIPARHLARTFMSIRTYPIRVGDLNGNTSGGWYSDQTEVTWAELGQEPELTTVTKRIRRIATFSRNQFNDALRANDPDYVFINFLNYLPEEHRDDFIEELREFGDFGIIGGYGPSSKDIGLIP